MHLIGATYKNVYYILILPFIKKPFCKTEGFLPLKGECFIQVLIL